MNSAHKIAVLGKDVYILSVAEMAWNCRFLLSTLFDLESSPHDLVAYLFPQKAKLYNP